MLARLLSTWHKLELSWNRKHQPSKYLYKIGLWARLGTFSGVEGPTGDCATSEHRSWGIEESKLASHEKQASEQSKASESVFALSSCRDFPLRWAVTWKL